MNSTTLYSAAQLARAARVSRTALLKRLGTITPRGVVMVNGNPASAWSIDDLPEDYRAKISANAAAAGCRDAHHLLSQPAAEWQPPLPLSEVAAASIDKADKLRRALARALELRNQPGISSQALDTAAVEDFKREFGYLISDRHARALLKRTVDRDNLHDNFNRLEIYLDHRPARKPRPAAALDALAFREIQDLMATFRCATEPSPRERESLWLESLKCFACQMRAGADERDTRKALLNFLWKAAPWLAKSRETLRVLFFQKRARWLEKDGAESALQDGRHRRKGEAVADLIPQSLVDAIVSCATFQTGGRVSQAVREVYDRRGQLGLDPAAAELLQPDPADKSRVNHRVRAAVTPEVRMLENYPLGSRALDNVRAHVDRDYSNLPSGFCMSADDVTLPVYWYVPDGQGWWQLVRGQCLITIDFRSMRILGFSLQPDRNYSSPVIHTLFTKVFADYGVPPHLYLEGCIWKNSKLITGGPRAERVPAGWSFMPLSWSETERGFGDLGVTFHHAIRARSKVVERVIGLVQDQMEAEPGYCGRDERRDCPLRTKRQMDEVKFHREHPGKYFYDGNQWEARLGEIFKAYNATPQHGKILQDLSPDQAYEQLQDAARAPMLFGDACRHLLSLYRVRVMVGNNGITVRIGSKPFVYRNERTGQEKGLERLAWFNPHEPSILAVTDLNMKNPYSVELSNSVPALALDDREQENLAEELARVDLHEKHGRTRYQVLKANFAPVFRRVLPNRATVETGAEITRQREAIQTERVDTEKRQRRIQGRARTLGLPAVIMNGGELADEGTALMLEARREYEASLAVKSNPDTK